MTPEAFAAEAGVSRETLDRLRRYADLLVKWNRKINLVGQGTLADLWRGSAMEHVRHCHRQYDFDALPLCGPCDEWYRP